MGARPYRLRAWPAPAESAAHRSGPNTLVANAGGWHATSRERGPHMAHVRQWAARRQAAVCPTVKVTRRERWSSGSTASYRVSAVASICHPTWGTVSRTAWSQDVRSAWATMTVRCLVPCRGDRGSHRVTEHLRNRSQQVVADDRVLLPDRVRHDGPASSRLCSPVVWLPMLKTRVSSRTIREHSRVEACRDVCGMLCHDRDPLHISTDVGVRRRRAGFVSPPEPDAAGLTWAQRRPGRAASPRCLAPGSGTARCQP